MRFIRWLFVFGVCVSCVTTQIPDKEYTLAKAAYDASLTSEAAKYAPQIFFKMEKAFKRAEHLYKERYYDEAREEFLRAQKLAERAETAARLKQFTTGDSGDN